MKRPFSYLVLAMFMALTPYLSYASAGVDETPLCIVTKDGVHMFSIEIARTRQEKAMGLMFRDNIARDHGMLFIYSPPQDVAMWMKNTFIPLDLVFIQKRGAVANIVHEAVPHDLSPRASKGRVASVLELAAGVAKAIDLKEGDLVYHPSISRVKDKPDVCKN